MTKAELIDAMAASADLTKTAAEAALNGLMHSVQTALKKGDKVTLTGFGTFSVSERAARTGRNPQTGEPITIKATKVPRFKPGAELKAAVQK